MVDPIAKTFQTMSEGWMQDISEKSIKIDADISVITVDGKTSTFCSPNCKWFQKNAGQLDKCILFDSPLRWDAFPSIRLKPELTPNGKYYPNRCAGCLMLRSPQVKFQQR